MVRVNVGLAIIVLQILLSHYQQSQGTFLKDMETKKKSLVELALTKMNMGKQTVNIVQWDMNAQINR